MLGGDLKLPALLVLKVGDRLGHVVEPPDHGVDLAKEDLGLWRGDEPAPGAFEELEPGFAFEQRKQVRDAGLRYAEVIGRTADGADLDHRMEGLKLAESEGHGILITFSDEPAKISYWHLWKLLGRVWRMGLR